MNVQTQPSTNIQCYIQTQIDSTPVTPEDVVLQIQQMTGPVDLYCWFEGKNGVPRSGAEFMKERIFRPLYTAKKDITLCLYSLKAWNFDRTVKNMEESTRFGTTVTKLHAKALEYLGAASFFSFLARLPGTDPMLALIKEQRSQKQWLFDLSRTQTPLQKSVGELFDNKPPLAWLADQDISRVYSLLQYLEGFYLIRRSVERSLASRQTPINIAFVLPNDECKYYRDLPQDVVTILPLWFPKELDNKTVNIAIRCFQYGKTMESRPYNQLSSRDSLASASGTTFFDYLNGPAQKVKTKAAPNGFGCGSSCRTFL